MTDKKVSALTDGTTANATDRIPVARSPFGSGDNAYITPEYLDTYMASTTKTLTNKTLTSPTLTTPTLGVASATSINKVALTAPATGSTLTIADGKTLTANNSLTFAGTDSTTMTFPSTSATIARTDAANTFSGVQTFADGTSAAPSITFSGSTNTGLYQTGNQLAFTRAGTLVAYFASNGNFVLSAIGLSLDSTKTIGWNADTYLSRPAAATLQLGAADAASPVAQTVQFQSSTSTNNTGADATFIASRSAGSGASGKIIFKGGVTGASSGTTNTSVAALTITSGTTNNTNVGYPSVVVGAGAAVATNATDGFLYIPTCAGTPTGTPTTQTGAAPLVVDSSNNKLYVYVGGAWTAMN